MQIEMKVMITHSNSRLYVSRIGNNLITIYYNAWTIYRGIFVHSTVHHPHDRVSSRTLFSPGPGSVQRRLVEQILNRTKIHGR